MSFTTTVKNEICSIVFSKLESLVFLSAFVRNNGDFSENLVLFAENPKIVRKIFSMFKEIYEINPVIVQGKSLNFNKRSYYNIVIEDKKDFILHDLNVFKDNKFLSKPSLFFVDSDDYIEVDYLEELISYETINNSEIIAISNKLDEKNKSITLSRDKFGLLFSLYKFDKFCPPWGKLFKKNIIFNHKLRFNIKIRLGEDMMFVLSYLLNTEKITLVSSNKYNYEIGRPDSLTKVLNSYDTELAGYARRQVRHPVHISSSRNQKNDDVEVFCT